ncbi:hypothetical protein K461DRAFT_314943 [Myriangium duriaei CBS 260.36]|uniref:Uncharacterized protein n=1 Tax=Myriangium duriaei CBS 260.36 TaxID=1168546 RepID=A0A9P4MHC2_9PEZI|nr:hypothetical protein K461DRAFT_314943 [Myriangium duriaei CBS 260.36]
MAKTSWRLTLLTYLPLACAIPFESLFTRQAQCGGQTSLNACGTGFPPAFCCPANSVCQPFNGNGLVTTICCPTGASCDAVQPIICNITLQNARLFPANPIHTTNLNATLPQCDGQCCPLGFNCVNNSCVANNSKAATNGSASASSSTASKTSTSSPSSPTSSTTNSSSPSAGATGTSFSGRSFAAGFFPGIILGAAVLFGIIFFLARRRTASKSKSTTSSSKPAPPPSPAPCFARQISAPVAQNPYAVRTDFSSSSRPGLGTDKMLPPPPPPPVQSAARAPEVRSAPGHTSYQAVPRHDTPPLPPLPLNVSSSKGSVNPPQPLRFKPQRISRRDSDRASRGTIRVVMSPDPTPGAWDGGREEGYRLPVPPQRYGGGGGEEVTPSKPPKQREDMGSRETRFSNFMGKGFNWR